MTASNVYVPKAKKRRLGWYDGTELAILDLWEKRVEDLRGVRKNGHIYAETSIELTNLGFPHSPREIQVKLQNFTQRYRREKLNIVSTGGSPSTWPHYERVHEIIGGFKANIYKEISKESIGELSIDSKSSISLISPGTPTPSSLTPPSPFSPSPGPSTSKATLDPKQKKKISTFQEQLLQKFNNLSSEISEDLSKSDDNEKELIAIEKRKADNLEKLLLVLKKN